MGVELTLRHIIGRGERGRVGAAAATAAVDATVLIGAMASGLLTPQDVLLGVWAQTAIAGTAVVQTLRWAVREAPDTRQVAGGHRVKIDGQRVGGKPAARRLTRFFVGHYGWFVGLIGVFVVAVAGVRPSWWLMPLLVRAWVVNRPQMQADREFVASHGFAWLAGKAEALTTRPYLRVVPLWFALLALVAPMADAGPLLAVAVAMVAAGLTLVESLWRYPAADSLYRMPPAALDEDAPTSLTDLPAYHRRQVGLRQVAWPIDMDALPRPPHPEI